MAVRSRLSRIGRRYRRPWRTPMNAKRTLLALGTIGLLALTAVAVPVLAKPSDSGSHAGPGPRDGSAADNRTDRRDARQDARESRHEAMRDAHDQWQACKRDYRDNQTDLNDSM